MPFRSSVIFGEPLLHLVGLRRGEEEQRTQRHLLTDTLGLLLSVLVTPASTTDRDAARILLSAAKGRFERLSRVWANGGYPAISSTGVQRSSGSMSVSSAAATTSAALRSCPVAGSWKELLPGACAAGVWSVITSGAPTPAKSSSCGR
ncbi:transposase [Streptomyces albogriseolus]|uniref:transposase n=1 Tax=Streptomyces TaxID=1883 RepID=UPI00350E467D